MKLPKARVAALIAAGVGRSFAPAGRVFGEWLSVPTRDRQRWLELLREGVAFVGQAASERIAGEATSSNQSPRHQVGATKPRAGRAKR